MRVYYTTSDRTYWRYLCVGEHMTGGSICWSVNGEAIDADVEDLFLETMTPSEIDLSIAVEREAQVPEHPPAAPDTAEIGRRKPHHADPPRATRRFPPWRRAGAQSRHQPNRLAAPQTARKIGDFLPIL